MASICPLRVPPAVKYLNITCAVSTCPGSGFRTLRGLFRPIALSGTKQALQIPNPLLWLPHVFCSHFNNSTFFATTEQIKTKQKKSKNLFSLLQKIFPYFCSLWEPFHSLNVPLLVLYTYSILLHHVGSFLPCHFMSLGLIYPTGP